MQNLLANKPEALEYIIIDGKSNDSTLEIIDKYSDRIDHFVSESDHGIYDAMNKGLKIATGQYVLFINAGDGLYHESSLDQLLTEISKTHEDIYYGETMLIDSSEKEIGTRSDRSSRKLPKQLNWKSLKRGMVVSHQAFIVKKSITPFYDLKYTSSSDIDWVIKCLKKASSIINLNRVLSTYLVGGYSKQTLQTSLKERYKILQYHYGFIPNLINHLIITLRGVSYKVLGKEIN